MRRGDVDLVSYCPGDAVGSPAGLPLARAEQIFAQDSAYLVEVGPLLRKKRTRMPHIGGTCSRCRPELYPKGD